MYVKIFGKMLRSSIWAEPPETRIVWITLLILADRDGFVEGVASGLAREANVSLEACHAALKTLSGPDVESQSQEYGGRRIEAIEGGWQIINYKKYRGLVDDDTRREQTRARVRRHRQRTATTGDAEKRPVTHGNGLYAYTDANAEADNNQRLLTQSAPPRRRKPRTDRARAAAVLREAGVPDHEMADAIRNFWDPAVRRFTPGEVADVVLTHGARFKAKGESWNPARVWNPGNEQFDERFRWAIKQARENADRGAADRMMSLKQSLGMAS